MCVRASKILPPQTNETSSLTPGSISFYVSTTDLQSGHTRILSKTPQGWERAISHGSRASIGYRFRPLFSPLKSPGRPLARFTLDNTFLWLPKSKRWLRPAFPSARIYTHAANLMTVWCAIFIPSDSRNTRGHTCELLGNYWPTMNHSGSIM